MMTASLRTLFVQYPLLRRVAWVVFAIAFYLCGERFTIWLVEPENFNGGIEWLGVFLFPFILVLFFMTGRYLGCASGQCNSGHDPGQCSTSSSDSYYQRPPGL